MMNKVTSMEENLRLDRDVLDLLADVCPIGQVIHELHGVATRQTGHPCHSVCVERARSGLGLRLISAPCAPFQIKLVAIVNLLVLLRIFYNSNHE